MVIMLGLAAAVLYGAGDFLGGLTTRKVQVLVVLALAETAGVIVAVPAAVSQPRAVAGSSSRSEPWSPSQVLTNDCTSSRGIGAGLVSWSGTHGGTVMTAILPISDHLSRLTGLFVTVKIILLVTNRRLAVLRAA